MKMSHICRCHVCGAINESRKRVEKCSDCGKPVGRFYYFDDRLTPIYSDYNLRPIFREIEVQPIYGLTAFWET